ncbi:MAG: hypothetical protein KAV82_05180 [Phycisphaerae bacterium]|nr:hypothetical protein [Phycisphaerae bacterium]
MSDVLIYWRDYAANRGSSPGKASGLPDDGDVLVWHSSAKCIADLQPGDRMWMVTSGKGLDHRRDACSARRVARATGGTDKARANTPGTTTKALSRALSVGLGHSAPTELPTPSTGKDRQVAPSQDERLPGAVLARATQLLALATRPRRVLAAATVPVQSSSSAVG